MRRSDWRQEKGAQSGAFGPSDSTELVALRWLCFAGQGLQRGAKMTSLPQLKAEAAATLEFLRAVDPFRDGLDTELLATGQHTSHERVFASGVSELVDQPAIHLDEIHAQPMQILQRGGPCAEIVNAYAVSHSAQSLDRPIGRHKVRQLYGFRHFDQDALGQRTSAQEKRGQ